MKKIALLSILLAAASALQGCIMSADHAIRIYKLNGAAEPMMFGDAAVSGCIVLIDGNPTGVSVTSTDPTCAVQYGTPLSPEDIQ